MRPITACLVRFNTYLQYYEPIFFFTLPLLLTNNLVRLVSIWLFFLQNLFNLFSMTATITAREKIIRCLLFL